MKYVKSKYQHTNILAQPWLSVNRLIGSQSSNSWQYVWDSPQCAAELVNLFLTSLPCQSRFKLQGSPLSSNVWICSCTPKSAVKFLNFGFYCTFIVLISCSHHATNIWMQKEDKKIPLAGPGAMDSSVAVPHRYWRDAMDHVEYGKKRWTGALSFGPQNIQKPCTQMPTGAIWFVLVRPQSTATVVQ